MARKRTAEAHQEPTPTSTALAEPPAETLPPGATDFNPAELESQNGQPHIANPSSRPRDPIQLEGHAAAVTAQRRKVEHSQRRFPAGELNVHYMDKADNEAGIGVMIEFPGNRKPTDEEKTIIRRIMNGEGEKYPTNFKFRKEFGMWHKHFQREGEDLRDVPPNRIRAIRYDAEKRAERLAEALLHHQKDPAGYAEMIQQQREQAAESQRIPD